MPETRKLKTLPGPGGLLVGLSGGLERIRDLPAEPAGTLIRFRQQELAGSPELLHAVVLGANHHGPVGANGEGRDRPRHARQLAQVHGAVHVPDLEAAGARADDDVVVHHREPDAVRIPGHVEGRDERAVDSVHLDHRVQRACGDHGARRAEAAALYRPAMAGDGASQRILRSVWGDLVDLPQPERPVRPRGGDEACGAAGVAAEDAAAVAHQRHQLARHIRPVRAVPHSQPEELRRVVVAILKGDGSAFGECKFKNRIGIPVHRRQIAISIALDSPSSKS
mmetsp:Transcript_3522/g.10262  ORF Transcript_3522/g.10262 Transcript_3522/m.10262 type:complete len:281 (+) Transcript_3522:257-1099(+)